MIASADIKSIIADVERLPGKHVIYKLRSGQHAGLSVLKHSVQSTSAAFFGNIFRLLLAIVYKRQGKEYEFHVVASM